VFRQSQPHPESAARSCPRFLPTQNHPLSKKKEQPLQAIALSLKGIKAFDNFPSREAKKIKFLLWNQDDGI